MTISFASRKLLSDPASSTGQVEIERRALQPYGILRSVPK
jgi:hypothetical protein